MVPGLIAAEKSRKLDYIKILRNEINIGRIKFKKDSQIVEEMSQIIWNEKCDDMDSNNGLHSDLVDALIYSMRYIYNNYMEKVPSTKRSSEGVRMEQEVIYKVKESHKYSERSVMRRDRRARRISKRNFSRYT